MLLKIKGIIIIIVAVNPVLGMSFYEGRDILLPQNRRREIQCLVIMNVCILCCHGRKDRAAKADPHGRGK